MTTYSPDNDECPGPRDPAEPDCEDVGFCRWPEDAEHVCRYGREG